MQGINQENAPFIKKERIFKIAMSCQTGERLGGAVQNVTRKAWLALSLRVESSGLSTGVWLVNFESNWLTSSADCCKDRWRNNKAYVEEWRHEHM